MTMDILPKLSRLGAKWRELANFVRLPGEVRLALVVRKDANLPSGAVLCQCAEAAVNAYKHASEKSPRLLQLWNLRGEPKVVLKVKNIDEMKTLIQKADESNILTSFAYDKDNPNPTVVGFGPHKGGELDLVTGQLKLF